MVVMNKPVFCIVAVLRRRKPYELNGPQEQA